MYGMKAGYEREMVSQETAMSFCPLKAQKADLSRALKKPHWRKLNFATAHLVASAAEVITIKVPGAGIAIKSPTSKNLREVASIHVIKL